MAAKGCDSARARRHSPGPPTGRIAAAIPERRFSACQLAANLFASWQPMHAIYMVDLAFRRWNELSAPSTQSAWQTSDVGARPFEATNTSSDLVSARLRSSGGLAPAQD